MGTFIATVFGLCAAVGVVYPDKVSAPKTYPGGLEAELGGKGAVLVSTSTRYVYQLLMVVIGKEARRQLVDQVQSNNNM